MARSTLSGRLLGEILVEHGLLTEGGLARALAEQARTGRLLGEILVDRGWLSPEELADALAGQEETSEVTERHLVERSPPPAPRVPLGRLLVDKGLLGEEDLARALEEQRSRQRPLGQILLEMGAVSPQDLARTLTEQHGFDFSGGLRARLSAAEEGADAGEWVETFRVRETGQEEPLYVASTFLDAADAAFELIEERAPARLEIVRARGGEHEVVWSYGGDNGLPVDPVP
jgi:hypothetical protein